MEPDCGYGMSESDLEVVEEASRKGMRKAICTQNGWTDVYVP